MSRQWIEVNVGELDEIIDRSTRAPLSELEVQKLKNRAACHGGEITP